MNFVLCHWHGINLALFIRYSKSTTYKGNDSQDIRCTINGEIISVYILAESLCVIIAEVAIINCGDYQDYRVIGVQDNVCCGLCSPI